MFTRQYKQWMVGLGILALILLPVVGKAIGAEEYPARMIKIICGYSPGGSTDRQARLLLPFLQKHLGQSVILENLTGAQGILANNRVFSSPPDGYTLLVSTSATMILQEKYLPETSHYITRDLTHVFSFVREDFILLSHPEAWKNFAEFLNGAQKRHLRIGITAKAGHSHLYTVMLEEMTGLKFNTIPFEGGGPSMAALVGKHVDAVTTVFSNSLPLIRSGTLLPLLVFSTQRSPNLPQTPIPKEVGFKSFEPFEYITGIFGPPKMPTARVRVLEEAFAKAAKEPEFLDKAKEMVVEAYHLNSKDYLAKTEKQYSQVDKYIDFLK